MEQEILTDVQKKIISEVAKEPKLENFYLSGGTALAACYFGHRFSDDLDFFCYEEPDRNFLSAFAAKLTEAIGAEDLSFEKLHDRSLFYFKTEGEDQKLEFTKYPFLQLEKPITWYRIKADSLRDVAANKLMAMLDRFDPKDFVDLYFLLERFSLDEIRADAEKKFGAKISDIFLGSELSKVGRITALPRMIKNVEIGELKDFFAKEAKKLESKVLD